MSKNVYANRKKTNALLIPIILMMGFGKHLITNTSFWGNLDSLNFNMAESGIGGGRHHWKYCDCQYHIFWGKNQEHDYRYLSYTKTYRQNWIGTLSGP